MEKSRNNGIKLPIINQRFLLSIVKILSSNLTITKKFLNNLDQLFDILDLTYYSQDIILYAIIETIKIASKQRQNNNKFTIESLMAELEARLVETYQQPKDNLILPTILKADTTTEYEFTVVNKLIDTYLKYSTVIMSKNKMSEILTDLSVGNVMELETTINKYRSLINLLQDEFRRTDSLESNETHLLDDNYESILLKTHDAIQHPANYLKTGLKMFNAMLSEPGGVPQASYVVFYALINSFKSALLQYFVKWFRMYNSDSFLPIFKETGKIPLILHYNFENTENENTQREFTMQTGLNLKDIETADEVKKIWKENFNPTNSIIDVAHIYAEATSMKVSDIRRQVHSKNDAGYMVIAVIVDYLELLKPEDEDSRSENRIKLGNISKSLHVLAVTENVTVITAMQMNRAAESAVAELRAKEATNIINSLGSTQYIGESYAIEKPAEFTAYIALERSPYDKKLYLTIKRGKMRHKRTNVTYMVHELKNDFVIEDDILLDKTLSKIGILDDQSYDMKEELDLNTHVSGSRGKNNIRSKTIISPKE
jgi:hypothetical protein